MTVRILCGDVREKLKQLPDESVHCVVTSPPYYGLRDYGTAKWEGGDPACDHKKFNGYPSGLQGSKESTYSGKFHKSVCQCGARRVDGQIGLEDTPSAFVAVMVEVFRDVHRVLRKDGTLWLNLGDSYTGSGKGGNPEAGKQATNKGSQTIGVLYGTGKTAREAAVTNVTRKNFDLGPKQLMGIPWRVAFALQADGWYLRQDIIWSKPNPMPESVTDRCTKAHEYLFLLSKNERYRYDADAIAEPAQDWSTGGPGEGIKETLHYGVGNGGNGGLAKLAGRYKKTKIPGGWETKPGAHGTIHREGRTTAEYQDTEVSLTRNRRSVWTVATQAFPEAHFATFPPALIEPCILAGCPKDGTVLDPFFGAGTTGLVADRLGRNCIGIELNPEYAAMAERRIRADSTLFADVALVAADA